VDTSASVGQAGGGVGGAQPPATTSAPVMTVQSAPMAGSPVAAVSGNVAVTPADEGGEGGETPGEGGGGEASGIEAAKQAEGQGGAWASYDLSGVDWGDPNVSAQMDRVASDVSLEGETNLDVFDPYSGHTITDIDLINGGTLWEEKSAWWAQDDNAWVAKNIYGKFESYLEARRYLPARYANAPIGFAFEQAPDVPLGAAVVNAVDQLRADNPSVTIYLQWEYPK